MRFINWIVLVSQFPYRTLELTSHRVPVAIIKVYSKRSREKFELVPILALVFYREYLGKLSKLFRKWWQKGEIKPKFVFNVGRQWRRWYLFSIVPYHRAQHPVISFPTRNVSTIRWGGILFPLKSFAGQKVMRKWLCKSPLIPNTSIHHFGGFSNSQRLGMRL